MKCKSILVLLGSVDSYYKIVPHRPNNYCLMDCVKWRNECNIKEVWIVEVGWLRWVSI